MTYGYFHEIEIYDGDDDEDETPLFQQLAEAEQPIWAFIEGLGYFVMRQNKDGTWGWQRPPEGWSPP